MWVGAGEFASTEQTPLLKPRFVVVAGFLCLQYCRWYGATQYLLVKVWECPLIETNGGLASDLVTMALEGAWAPIQL